MIHDLTLESAPATDDEVPIYDASSTNTDRATLGSLFTSMFATATGGQLAFPATQNASANANTLDDYEEGTWTPTDGSGAGLTFSSAVVPIVGVYIKVGAAVWFMGGCTYPATANASAAVIASLPFTSQNTNGVSVMGASLSNAGTSPDAGKINNNSTTASLVTHNNTTITNANMSGALFQFSGVYTV